MSRQNASSLNQLPRKKPFSSQIIKDILDAYNKEDANLKDVRIAALCSLAFAGFFRYNELCNISPNHIEFHSQYIKIFVPRSKTDVYREGNYVYISASGTSYCPVSVLSSMVTRSRCGDGVSVVMTLPHRVELIWPRTQAPCLVRRSVAVKFISYRGNPSRKCSFPAKCVGIFDYETFMEVRK